MSRLGSLNILEYLGGDIVNEALIKQVAKYRKTNKESNNEVISAKTGIDKSTVSLHLSSQRQVSLADCRKYAQFLSLPLIKVIDDKLVKYPVSAYVNNNGEVLMRQPHQNEIIIQPNEIESTGEYAIYNQDFESLHWYHPQIHSQNIKKLDEEDTNQNIDPHNMYNDLVYMITTKGQFIGEIQSFNPKTHDVVWFNLHTSKKQKSKLVKAYPITSITKLKYAQSQKIEQVL